MGGLRNIRMNTLLLATSFLGSSGGLIQLLVFVAIACVVIWGIIALVKWSGIAIPQPVWIILTCFVCIFLIILIARAFGMVM